MPVEPARARRQARAVGSKRSGRARASRGSSRLSQLLARRRRSSTPWFPALDREDIGRSLPSVVIESARRLADEGFHHLGGLSPMTSMATERAQTRPARSAEARLVNAFRRGPAQLAPAPNTDTSSVWYTRDVWLCEASKIPLAFNAVW